MNKERTRVKKTSTVKWTLKGVLLSGCVLFTMHFFLGSFTRYANIVDGTYRGFYHHAGMSLTERVGNHSTRVMTSLSSAKSAGVIHSSQLESIIKGIVIGENGTKTANGSLHARLPVTQQKVIRGQVRAINTRPQPQTSAFGQFSCSACSVHNFKYFIQNDDVCKLQHPEQTVDILFLVFSVHGQFEARNAIRSTWLSVAKGNTANIRYVFLLGRSADPQLSAKVIEENKQYKDIIQEDFQDAYLNLTLKSIMGYKWASTKCAHARVVVKTDDDMFINIPALEKVIQTNQHELPSTILGSCSSNASPNRSKKSKWYASIESYRGNRYPGFCSGTCYVTSMTVAEKIYKISESVPFFHLEDVYIGLCLNKVRGKVKNIPGFNRVRPKLDPCLYRSDKLVTSHSLPPKLLRDIWNQKCLHMKK